MLLHKGEPLIIEREKTTIFKDHDIPQIITRKLVLYMLNSKRRPPQDLKGCIALRPDCSLNQFSGRKTLFVLEAGRNDLNSTGRPVYLFGVI